MKPTVGRIVHFVMGSGVHRPAIIVHVWDENLVNLQVFTDGSNDGQCAVEGGTLWKTSVRRADHGNEISTWHWPEPATIAEALGVR